MKKILIKSLLVITFAVCTMLFVACAGGNSPSSTEASSVTSKNTSNIESEATPLSLPESKAFDIIPEKAVKWIEQCENPDTELMPVNEIQKMNEQTRKSCTALKDVLNHDLSMSGDDVLEMITNSFEVSLPKYDASGNEITDNQLYKIKMNRNLDAVSEIVNLKRGVTVQRTDVRTLPTDLEFYNYSYKQDHDRMQETELSAGSAVLILHTSSDGMFYFIQSYFYIGWVRADNIGIAQDTESINNWTLFAKLLNMQENMIDEIPFITITDALLNIDGVKLSMGTFLPLSQNQENKNFYKVLIPCRKSNGTLGLIEKDISINSACVGFAKYNMKNFYIQAFKYLGTPYGWGGMKDGVDCSGYVLNVFKSFGFIFPRNTGEQKDSVGNQINTEYMSDSEIKEILKENSAPTAIYIPGHVMLYLGEIDGDNIIIHAQGGFEVCEACYNDFSSVTRACVVGI